MKVNITVHQRSYATKPNDLQCGEIRRITENTVREVNTYDLAGIVANKQSFYLGVHNLSSEQGKQYISKDTFVSQSVFAIDLDHGNFTLEEIQERLGSVNLFPNLIYKTFGYQEPHNRRWRILFFDHNAYTSEDDVRRIQEYLMYVMGYDFKEHGEDWVRHLDTSVKDTGRILFAGIEIPYLNDYVHTDFRCILTVDVEKQVNLFLEDVKKAKKALEEREKGTSEGITTPYEEKAVRELLNRSEAMVLPEANDMEALASKIIKQLELLAMIMPNKPYAVDYYERYEFINQLPLHMLLGVELNQKFNCVLPNHIDEDPSAHILLSTDGKNQQVYRCFGCMENHHGYRTFNVIAFIFEEAFGYPYKVTLDSIYKLLKIQLGSEYQRRCHAQIEHDLEFLDSLGKDHPLMKKLQIKRSVGFYKSFLLLSKSKVSYECMLKEDQEEALVFFAANTYIQDYMREKWSLKMSSTTVNRRINYLVKIGLIDKTDYKDLTPIMRKKAEKFIEQTKIREQEFLQSPYKRNPDYYRINFLSPSLIEEAVQFIELEKKLVVRSKGQGAKQTKAAHGETKAKKVYTQSNLTYSKEEERFLKLARIQIPQLLEKNYFTEAEMIKRIDPKAKYWKKSEKEQLSQTLFPQLVNDFKLEKRRVNKDIRRILNVPAKITSNHHVIFQSSALETA